MAIKREFQKVNEKPIPVEYGVIIGEGENPVPYFEFEGDKHLLDYFVRAHNNPWVADEFPEYIHAFDAENYWNPVFIELVEDEYFDGDTCVNVYITKKWWEEDE